MSLLRPRAAVPAARADTLFNGVAGRLTRPRHLALALMFTLVAAVLPWRVQAQTLEFTVDSILDQPDADIVDDTCDADPGAAVSCTLRAAIMQANVTPGDETIRLRAQRYRLTIAGSNEDLGASGDLDLRSGMTIVGTQAGRARSTIDASGLGDRVLDGLANNVSLQNLVISGGSLPATSGLGLEFDGGGIRNTGNMSISDSLIVNNSASRGGGIAHRGNTLTVTRTTVSSNRALGTDTPSIVDGGGGIVANARLIVRDSTVQNNSSAFYGGGLSLVPGTFAGSEIVRSLVVGNTAQASGGGIMLEMTNGGDFLLDNSTVSANGSALAGGGIFAQNQSATDPAVVRASTIAANTAPFAGGVRIQTLQPTNVVFANNTFGNCVLGFPRPGSFNLSTDTTCVFDDPSTNKENVSAKLGALQFNGGPTRTHALLEGSPAIDGGVSFAPIAFDQRGAFRFAEFRPGGNRFDIGAFESNAFGVGEFTMTAPPSVLVEQPITLGARWTHPTRWRALNTVEVQLRAEDALAARVVYTEGVTTTAGIEVADGLALYNSDGSVAGVGVPGEATVLESDSALLDLAASSISGSGLSGNDVSLTLALRLKSNAAGRVYATTLLASDDEGTVQGPHETGALAVGPFRTALPVVAR